MRKLNDMLSLCWSRLSLSPCLLGNVLAQPCVNHSLIPAAVESGKKHSPERKSFLVFLHEFRPILMTMDWTVFLLICLFHLHSSDASLVGRGRVSACLPPHLCLHLSHLSDLPVRSWVGFSLTHTACLLLSEITWGEKARRHGSSGRLNKVEVPGGDF